MILKFNNGSDLQKQVVRETLNDLLHLPTDNLGLAEWEVEFVADPDEGKTHTEFAITKYEYSSGHALTKIRSDFPHFQRPLWNGLGFARECVAHEFFHAVFANLAPGVRDQIVHLFGASSDDPDIINDPDKPWERRVVEGIAETAKDAFLPQRYRRYSNRTKRRISIIEYPKFRALVRGVGGGSAGFTYLYGSDSFRVDLSTWGLTRWPYHKSPHDDEAFVIYERFPGFETCWGVDMSQFDEAGHMPFSIEPKEGEAT